MKRTFLALVAAMMLTISASAQRLTDIHSEARFITDKMAIELALTNVQRSNILNINLTYLDGIRTYRDINGAGWKYRNRQLKHLLSAKQWKRYKALSYFYRPIGWRENAYVHNIYAKYPQTPGTIGKPGKMDKPGKHNHKFDKSRPHYGNNSPEVIRKRQEMRRGVMPGAR